MRLSPVFEFTNEFAGFGALDRIAVTGPSASSYGRLLEQQPNGPAHSQPELRGHQGVLLEQVWRIHPPA